MLIDYVSDLHINHYVPFTHNQEKWKKKTKEWTKELIAIPKGELLVVAGDFSEWNIQSFWFLEEASKYYEKVLYVIGNHDYYIISKNQKRKYGSSIGRVKELSKLTESIENVEFLDKKVIEYKGYKIAGDSMWYTLTSDESKEWFKSQSNDYVYIQTFGPRVNNYKHMRKESMEWYNTLDEVDLFVSHFPPLHPPISPYPYNECYVAPVFNLVSDKWIFGHQHLQGKFEKAGVSFYVNTIGYPGEKHRKELRTIRL